MNKKSEAITIQEAAAMYEQALAALDAARAESRLKVAGAKRALKALRHATVAAGAHATPGAHQTPQAGS